MPPPSRRPPAPSRRRIELERTLHLYLELQIAQLERGAAAEVAAKVRAEVRSALGMHVTRMILLAVYTLVLGLASSDLVVSALFNPAELVRNAVAASVYTGQAVTFVPDALRGIAISALGAGALLVLRSASFRVRSDVGGALFVGAAIVSLVGLSAAAYSGVLGFFAALPGFVAATFVVYELLRSLRKIDAALGIRTRPAGDGPIGRATAAALDWLLAGLDPSGRLWVALVFLCTPWTCIALVAGSFFTNGGPLFWPSRTAMFTFGGWCVWAFVATPSVVRIPLWATVPWGVLLVLQLAATPVSYVFALSAIGLLFVNLVLVLWDRGHIGPEPAAAGAGPEA